MTSPLNYLRELEESLSIDYVLLNDVDLEEVAGVVSRLSKGSLIVQAIPSKLVLGWQQLALPAFLTWESLKKGYGPSKKAYIQYLLFFAATRQISVAIDKLRRHASNTYILVMAYPERFQELSENAVRALPRNSWRRSAKDEVGYEADLRAVKSFYGLNDFQKSASVNDLLLTVLTEIAYSKIEMLK
jgi:tRNA threonylcarbamoyladenosine modification (KEOPS) complex Cgi121 subunit